MYLGVKRPLTKKQWWHVINKFTQNGRRLGSFQINPFYELKYINGGGKTTHTHTTPHNCIHMPVTLHSASWKFQERGRVRCVKGRRVEAGREVGYRWDGQLAVQECRKDEWMFLLMSSSPKWRWSLYSLLPSTIVTFSAWTFRICIIITFIQNHKVYLKE